MNGTNGVSVSKVAQIMDLYNFLPDMDLKKHRIKISDVNRPALQLSGFFEHFEQSRVQIIGNVEYTYLQRLDVEKKEKILQKFTTYDIPCIIFCRDLQPDEDFLQIASENDVPVLGTRRSTSEFMAELIFCLSEQLAPCISIHGVLVDVYGEGLLIMGESGIGKSEAALELVRRGHRLVPTLSTTSVPNIAPNPLPNPVFLAIRFPLPCSLLPLPTDDNSLHLSIWNHTG